MEEKTKIRYTLEEIEYAIHLAWLKDLDKTNDIINLIKILKKILDFNTIEEFFENKHSDFEYFIRKFSNEVINNLLRNEAIQGDKGDQYALEIFICYQNIFLKFFAKQEYTPLFESIKEIFDPRKNFYKSNNITNLNPKISIEQFKKKRISGDYYNVYYLNN
jgi:hypothetical protein